MKKNLDIDEDLKALDMHEPSREFASMVTMKAVKQMESVTFLERWMKWVPRFCAAGFAGLLLTFAFIVFRYFDLASMNTDVVMILKALALFAGGYFTLILLDRILKRMIIG